MLQQTLKKLPLVKLWYSFKDYPQSCDSAGKESLCNVGDLGLVPGLERSPEEKATQSIFWPGEFHEQYSPLGPK